MTKHTKVIRKYPSFPFRIENSKQIKLSLRSLIQGNNLMIQSFYTNYPFTFYFVQSNDQGKMEREPTKQANYTIL